MPDPKKYTMFTPGCCALRSRANWSVFSYALWPKNPSHDATANSSPFTAMSAMSFMDSLTPSHPTTPQHDVATTRALGACSRDSSTKSWKSCPMEACQINKLALLRSSPRADSRHSRTPRRVFTIRVL